MALNDVLRVTATFTGVQTQVYQWVWHYLLLTSASIGYTALADAIEVMLTAAWADISDDIDNGVSGSTLAVAKWNSSAMQFDTRKTNDISALAGASVAEGFPSNVAPYVTFFTALARSRGKKFIFGPSEAIANNGLIIAAFLADLATFAAEFDNDIVGGSNTIGPGNFNPTTELFTLWGQTDVGVGLFTGSQYRRLPGRGE